MTDDIILDSWLDRARGVIGRYPDDGQRYIFRWDDIDMRDIRMLGVSKPLRVTWIADGTVTKCDTLAPWIGRGKAPADVIIEEAIKTPRART
ncbi:MAG: hypothetical protein RI531_09315 [Haloferacaceae archaeon]|nr:hypothetical protein [Haloferacaceae archaeon]